MRRVEKYHDPAQWNHLSELDRKEISIHIAPLVVVIDENESAKRFGLIMYMLQFHTLHSDSRRVYFVEKVQGVSRQLMKKTSILMVKAREISLKAVNQPDFWNTAWVKTCERIRVELRELIKFLDKTEVSMVVTDFADEIMTEGSERPITYLTNELEVYRNKVERYFFGVPAPSHCTQVEI